MHEKTKEYLLPSGKCAEEFEQNDYKKIFETDAEDIPDGEEDPNIKLKENLNKREKKYER